MSRRTPYTPVHQQQRSNHPSSAQPPQRSQSQWTSITGVLMDQDYVSRLELENVSSRTVSNILDPLLGNVEENIKQTTGMDLNNDKFKDRTVETEVYVGTDLGSFTRHQRIDSMNINRDKLLFAFHPGCPIAREYLQDAEIGKGQLKTTLRELMQEEGASKNSSSSQDKKGKKLVNPSSLEQIGKGLVNPSSLEQIYEKINQLEADNQQFKADNQQFKADNKQLKADNKLLKADNEQFKTAFERVNASIRENEAKNKADHQKLNNDILKTNTRALHRRVLLDQVRTQMINLGIITHDTTPTQDNRALNDIVHQVQQGLKQKKLKSLGEAAIRAVFDSGLETLRSPGNYAAHNAPDEYIAEAVLDTTLGSHYKQICHELFVWLKNRNPTLGV